MIDDEVYALLGALSECRAVNPSAEEQLTTDIIVATDELCSRVAQRHCRYVGLDWGRDADDLISLVREAEISLLAGIAAGDKDALACVPGFEASLFTRGHSVIRSYADSAAVTGVSGYTGVKRRQRALAQHQRRIQESGVEPLPAAELVADWNAAVSSARKDPRKQGAFAIEADIATPVRVYPRDPQDLSSVAIAVSPMDSVDMADVITRTIAACHAEDALLGQIATQWLAWFPDGEPMSPKDISERLCLSLPRTRQGIRSVRCMLRRSLATN